uniref:SAM domain-containing protein n=1 Tax=Globisporangium ultimum (strain ATCC 200006 / CBS 805.95 / DAOM BR144) TaxID=431595 RepID=K3X3H6_GLOUD
MGGPSAATAYTSSANAGSKEDTRHRLNASAHSLSKTTQYGLSAHSNSATADCETSNQYDENEQILDDGYDDDEEDDDEYDEQDEEEERKRAAERAEMRKHFNFPVQKQRATLKNHLMSAMQKKRRLLMRNENLRFRELYKPPEPIVLIIAVSLVTIVSLILSEHAALLLDAGSPRGMLAWTPLQYACAHGDDELVLSLLKDTEKEAVAVTGKTKYLYSALHVAVHFGHLPIVQLLLAHAPEIAAYTDTQASKVGSTALHLAVLHGHLAILKVLLDTNAKLVPTKNGTTPLDIANELGHTEIAQVLVDHVQKDTGREQIGNWLASIGLVEYAANFHAAGVDDARFLLATGLSDSILDTMKITKPGHRMKLQSLYQLKESIPDPGEESSDNEEVEDSDDASSGTEEDDESDDGEDASSDDNSESES